MKLIVISSSLNIFDEMETIFQLFFEGLQYFHLRKPEFTKKEYEYFLQQIPEQHRNKIIIHHYHELIESYNLKGIHHTSKTNFKSLSFRRKIHQSKSFHLLEEVVNNKYPYDYGFLSPIYNSISKPGYQSKFNFPQLTNFLSNNPQTIPLIALGGIDFDKIEEIKQMGFAGIAILGAIWQENQIKKRIEKFQKTKLKIEQNS
jgi:thiamine-phosphate pyrophosphorylase